MQLICEFSFWTQNAIVCEHLQHFYPQEMRFIWHKIMGKLSQWDDDTVLYIYTNTLMNYSCNDNPTLSFLKFWNGDFHPNIQFWLFFSVIHFSLSLIAFFWIIFPFSYSSVHKLWLFYCSNGIVHIQAKNLYDLVWKYA